MEKNLKIWKSKKADASYVIYMVVVVMEAN